ncbi:MAG: helix-turn-helix transcriptional regulator [Candidatus Gastranaerophilales bacterium]|nr:helix-turn-helix transcriptional regulator [Candidatus Gastranaerophilales bacterium]
MQTIDIYNRVSGLCAEAEISIDKLERSLCLHEGSVEQWANGRMPTAEEIVAIAQAFNTSCDYVVGLTDVREGVGSIYGFKKLADKYFSLNDRGKGFMVKLIETGFSDKQ